MDKMKFETPNLTAENVAKIAALFPGVVTEGKVNIDLLRTMLGEDVFTDEAYEFTWVGKRAAIAEAGRPIRKTLRPCPDESRNWDTTENLYIEGDNLDVLKLLQESYLGKVKMIYIDPPYNTGSDFIYRDNFAQSREEYDEDAGVYDEDGDRLFRNTKTNGRFHSDWCSMIYPRLVLARNLLRDDGVIFISIDDGEQGQLKKICDEVFGAENFIAQFIWEKRVTRENRKIISVRHDYLLCYTKRFELRDIAIGLMPMTDDAIERYNNPDNDPRGVWTSVPAIAQAGHGTVNQFYTLTTPSGRRVDPPSGSCWRYTQEKMKEAIADNRIWFGSDGNGVPRIKKFITEGKQGLTPETMWLSASVGTNDSAKRELVTLFDGIAVFETPKPVQLLKQCLQISTDTDAICIDFFSGTAPLAHAVMQLNAEDNGKRKFIMVQLPEVCAEGTEAAKAGYSTICEIGKERIRRAGDKIVDSVKWVVSSGNEGNADSSQTTTNHSPLTTNPPDIGFRVLKLADTNMNDVYYAASDYTQDRISLMESNIKSDRTDMDLLFGCLLDWGLPLSMPHQREWLVDGEKWLEIEKELERNGCKKLHRVAGLAESNGINSRSIPNCKETSERGVVCIVGSNASSCCIDPFQYSGGTGKNLHQGVLEIPLDSQGVKSRIGNATNALCESGLPCQFGYCNSDAIGAGSGQNAKCPHENTNHCPLNTKHSSLTTVHTYNGGDLIACFEERISETAIREIASRKPLRAVFRDSSFTSSPEKINVFEIFKLLAPNTNVRVI